MSELNNILKLAGLTESTYDNSYDYKGYFIEVDVAHGGDDHAVERVYVDGQEFNSRSEAEAYIDYLKDGGEPLAEKVVGDLKNGYDHHYCADGEDYFPDGAEGAVISDVGPAGARQGDNPEQKGMKEELEESYKAFKAARIQG